MKFPIRNGEAIIDDYLQPILSFFVWSKTNSGYASATLFGKKIAMHRLIMGAKKHDVVDHINGNQLDNRVKNLRFVTRAQNTQNSSRLSSTGFIGVTYTDGVFVASIKFRGRRFHLGRFTDPVDAALVYDFFAEKYYGPLARTNIKYFKGLVKTLSEKKCEKKRLYSKNK